MIRKIFTIAALYLRTTYTSRSTLIFTIAMPLIFTLVLAQAMQGMAPDAPPEQWQLLAVDEDHSRLSATLLERLDANPLLDVQMTDRESALADVKNNEALAALLIPNGFETLAFQAAPVTLTFYRSAEAVARAQIMQEAVNATSAELSGSLNAADLSVRVAEQVTLFNGASTEAEQAWRQEAFAAAESAWESGTIIAVRSEKVTRLESKDNVIPIGASQSSPGMLVMYALFFTFGGGATLIVERDEGTLRRLLVMPLTKSMLLAGKLLGIFVGALVQMSVMVVFGMLVFGLRWGQSPGALVLMLLSYGFASTALGLMVAALARTVAQANAAGTISIMALASLGGAWWPIEIVPAWMQKLALALPTGWAMRGFQDIIVRGLGLPAVLLEAMVLFGFGLLFLTIGIWRFRYE
ncbi:MAG: ABC transporter permease [Anaerolineales bacterium]|nr:ABC transporter permease [Anaerolineales bacterium]